MKRKRPKATNTASRPETKEGPIMAKLSTKTILAALKRGGVNVEDPEKVEDLLDDIELRAEEFIGSDQIILDKAEHRELKDDLTKLRKRAKDAEADAKDLREAMDAGDSDNARKAKTYKQKLDDQDPIIEKLLEAQKTIWAGLAEKIPEKIKAEFRFAEEGKELSVDDLLHNTAKAEEYTRVGLLGEGAPTDPPPEIPPVVPRIQPTPAGDGKFTAEQLEKLTPTQMVELGYKAKPAGT